MFKEDLILKEFIKMPKDKQDALYIKKLYNKISDFC
jgi:hypothetical protein